MPEKYIITKKPNLGGIFLEEKIKELRIGQVVYFAYDDRPLDGFGVSKAIITELHEDHMMIKDEYSSLWINYEDLFGEKDGSCACFLTEEEANAFIAK